MHNMTPPPEGKKRTVEEVNIHPLKTKKSVRQRDRNYGVIIRMHLCPGGSSSVANCRQKTAQDELSSPYSPVKGRLCPHDRQYPSCG